MEREKQNLNPSYIEDCTKVYTTTTILKIINNYTDAKHEWGKPERLLDSVIEIISLKIVYHVNNEVMKK